MTRGEDGQFSWTGVLEEGSIVFTVSENAEWPCYGAGEEEGKLKYISEATDDDITIKIKQTGNYYVTADLINLTYTITYAPVPIPDILYITGDVIQPRSFFSEERMQSTEVRMQSTEPGVFTYNDWVEPGLGFRFATERLSLWPGFVKDKDSADGFDVRYFSNDPGAEYNNEFVYTGEAGWKLITIDINIMRVSITDGRPVPSQLAIGGSSLGSGNAGWT